MGSVAESVGESIVANRTWCFQGQDKWVLLNILKVLVQF